MHATLYTKDNCQFCTRAKALLDSKAIPYTELILDINGRDDRALTESQSWATRDQLMAANPNAKTVPQIWLDGEHIGGYTELAARFQSQAA